MPRKFQFKEKTIQFPWTPECRDVFNLHEDEASPAFYSVTLQLKRVRWTARIRHKTGTSTYTRYEYAEADNFLNLQLLKKKGHL